MKDYASEPFQFKIAGKPYLLQQLGFADIEKITNIGDLITADPAKGVGVIRDLVASRSDKRTTDAVMGLPPKKILELIKDWIGLTPGESSTSDDA